MLSYNSWHFLLNSYPTSFAHFFLYRSQASLSPDLHFLANPSQYLSSSFSHFFLYRSQASLSPDLHFLANPSQYLSSSFPHFFLYRSQASWSPALHFLASPLQYLSSSFLTDAAFVNATRKTKRIIATFIIVKCSIAKLMDYF